MKTSSAKAKGRRLQQWVRDRLLAIGLSRGLQSGDIESRGMGQNGVDVILSPAALQVFPFAIECKNVEKLNVVETFLTHAGKYTTQTPLLIHSKNRNPRPMVTMFFEDFMYIYEKALAQG